MKLPSILFKKKPKIRFYSLISAVQTLYPITQSRELKREWISSEKEDYKNRQSKCPVHKLGNIFSINKCPAVHNIMNAGFIMYAPADFKVHTNGDEDTILFSNAKIMPYADYVTTHNEEVAKWLTRNPSQYIFPKVVKVNTPWRVISDNDIIFIQIPVTFNSENRFSAVMGLVDPMMSHELNVQLFWHIKEGDITIKAGTPLCQYIPISRSLLHSLDYVINDLTTTDIKMEDEYLYLRSTMFPETADFQTRVSRMMKIIKKYN
jgi:hypothetical protein